MLDAGLYGMGVRVVEAWKHNLEREVNLAGASVGQRQHLGV